MGQLTVKKNVLQTKIVGGWDRFGVDIGDHGDDNAGNIALHILQVRDVKLP